MSGDVQPRKRKDKRRKKDELGVEEPRGTAAVFGEGDVLMHSHHDHGTGGHWCAKIIFFSLLAVLITLIGLIILENRGLSELEANAVESRYSGVLDGWIEDAHDDDHHDEHTLELKHQSYEEIHDDNDIKLDHEDEDIDEEGHSDEINDEEHEEDDEDIADNDDSEEQDEQDIGEDDDDSEEQDEQDIGEDDDDKSEEQETEDGDEENAEDDDREENDEDERDIEYEKFDKYDVDTDDDDEIHDKDSENIRNIERDNDDSEEFMGHVDDDGPNNNDNDELNYDEEESVEQDFDRTKNYETVDSNEKESKEDAEQENEDDDDETDEEIEKIEREVIDEEEEAVSYEANDDAEKDDQNEEDDNDDNDAPESPSEEDISVPPVVEPIVAPKGKPFRELDDETSSEKPTDTLAEEDEYERRQEELRQQKQESSSQMWLKLAVGGALLVATHAVIRRSTAPRDTPEVEDNVTREETPSLVDRRMTLIPQETPPLLPQETHESVHEEPIQKIVSEAKTIQSAPISKHESDEEEEEETPDLIETEVIPDRGSNYRDKELYSDEEEVEDEQEIVEEEKESEDKIEKDEESEAEEVADDVEIIDDEQIEEQIEEEIEEEDEEEISDVDDAELLSRLEAKYGRLPEPHRPEQKHKDGGNSVEDEWPGEPSEQYWRQQLDQAEREIRQGEWMAANQRLTAPELANSGRARWLAARSLDAQAEAKRDNALLTRAISAYLQVLKMYESLSDTKLREVAARALDRIQFRGNYLSAEPVYRLLIRRFPNEVSYRNNLTISFLMANRADLASDVLKETLKLWPEDRIALAHYAFVLKTSFNKLEESVALFRKALENDEGPACEPRFYYHLGDALLLLNRYDEAHEVHKRGAKHGHFLSPAQRSLYNVDHLKSRPWWSIEETPYVKLARALEKHWKDILKEGEAAKALYEKEKEGLKEKGDWSQLDIFVRGQEIPGRCKRAPVTCSIVKAEVAAANCRRGQIKFSSMEPGTHVRPHVGPTNCRLRMHLGLSNTKDTHIRVDQEIRQWQTGKVLLFDDSFEHEVWHNGTGTRLVLIVDVWHPDLTAKERRQLPAI